MKRPKKTPEQLRAFAEVVVVGGGAGGVELTLAVEARLQAEIRSAGSQAQVRG